MRHLLPTAVNGLLVLSIQLIALFTLGAQAFGVFSVQYLSYAFAASVMLSFVNESWTRTEIAGGERSPWRVYSATSFQLSFCAGLVTLVPSLVLLGPHPSAVLGAVAVAAGVYRSSVRYYRVRVGLPVLLGDLAGLIFTLGAWLGLSALVVSNYDAVVSSWTAGMFASAVIQTGRPHFRPMNTIQIWWNQHKASIRPLLRDSLLMDFGAIGTPILMAPILGLSSFGVYRAVSNVAAPVRLLLTPLRPVLMSVPIGRQRSFSTVLAVAGASASFGLLVFLVLFLIPGLDLGGSVISELSEFALPVGLYVASNTVGTYYMVVARGHVGGAELLLARIVHTVLAFVMPIGGALLAGLPGAIWGYTLCTFSWSLVWVFVSLRDRGRI